MSGTDEQSNANDATEQLKSTLWYYVGQLVDEEAINLGVNATPQFIGSLTELVWAQITNVSQDLESFAQHRSKELINSSDVVLLARRNDGLKQLLQAEVQKVKPGKAKR